MNTLKCDICNKIFSTRGNLNRHLTSIHSGVQMVCDFCGFVCNTKRSLERHIRRKHRCSGTSQEQVKCVKCPLCKETRTSKTDMVEHYVSRHEIVIQRETLNFHNEEELYNWKEKTEKEQVCEFVVSRSKTTLKSHCSSRMSYSCHRDGDVRTRGKHIRSAKRAGSNKINGHCPAKLDIVFHPQGHITVHYCKTHVGHTADLGRMRLKKAGRNATVRALAIKVPDDGMLDSVRYSIGSNVHEARVEENSDSGGNSVTEEIPNLRKEDAIVNVLQHQDHRSESKEQTKAKLKQRFEDILEKYDSDEDIEIINRQLQPLVAALEARRVKAALLAIQGPSCSEAIMF